MHNHKSYLPYQVAWGLTNLHLFRSWAVRLAFSARRPVHLVMLSLHCSLGLPLPRLPSTTPSSRYLCRQSCLMNDIPKMTAFSSLPFQTATFCYMRFESLPRSRRVLFSLCAVSTFQMIPGAAMTFCWWSKSRLHAAKLTRHRIKLWILV